MACALVLAGASAACAQDIAKPSRSPLKSALGVVNFSTEAPESKAFVRESRKPDAQLDYIPMVGSTVTRPKVKTAAEVQADQAKMDVIRSQHQSIAAAYAPYLKPAKKPVAAKKPAKNGPVKPAKAN